MKLLSFVGVLVASTVTLGWQASLHADTKHLSGDSIKQLIVGYWIEGVEDGTQWKEHFRPDGTIEGDWGGDAYQGTWKIENDMLCLDYVGTTDDGCWYLSRNQDGGMLWLWKDGTPDMRRHNTRVSTTTPN